MKVQVLQDGLIIKPQTQFETEYLEKNFSGHSLSAFLKTGATLMDTVGVKVLNAEKEV